MGQYASGPTQAIQNGDSAEVCVQPGQWSIQQQPAVATQATITKAAVANTRHVCTGLTVCLAAGATAQTPILVNLRDGATGVGTILWSGTLSAPANGCASIPIAGLNIPGSVNTAMTLEFAAAPGAAAQVTVSLQGHDVTGG